ncbi:TPM domain-containing protein, partial [Streptococcus agalactiae]|nr:TPM domain-containing protein [Streptococcus agalactiae]
ARKGQPYDVKNLPKEPLSWYWIPGALAIGFGIAFLIVTGMKGQLKSVYHQTGATDYIKKNSLQITNAQEFFLYSNVDKKAKLEPSSSSDSGGSSTHTSS